MNKYIKKLFGIDKIEAETKAAIEQAAQATALATAATEAAERAKEAERLAQMNPKERATALNEPYIAVLDTKVNKENVRNGFFELDWNDQFVVQLKEAGYTGTTQEEIVDQWFQELCRNVGAEAGVNMDRRGSGYVNFNNLGDGKSEVY
jgi:hypothetical protein